MTRRRHALLGLAGAVALAISGFGTGGCAEAQPERTVAVSNDEYSLDELFTDQRGNTVYRFFDNGDFRYYVVGPNGVQMLPTTRTVTETTAEPQTIHIERAYGHGHDK